MNTVEMSVNWGIGFHWSAMPLPLPCLSVFVEVSGVSREREMILSSSSSPMAIETVTCIPPKHKYAVKEV